jgi:CTP:molybdopterin cytidylyltransferase MocA
LAAGASTRAGFPKALATWGEQTFVERTRDVLLEGGCEKVWVVTAAPHAPQIERVLNNTCALLVNAAPHCGMSSSLLAALEDREVRRAPALLMALVDHPRVRPSTIAELIAAWKEAQTSLTQDRAQAFRPNFEGHGGHPLLLSASLFSTLRLCAPGADIRPLLRRSRVDVPSTDPGVVDDFDTSAEIIAAGASPPIRG